MARKDAIEVDDTVVELLPNTMFRVDIWGPSRAVTYVSQNALHFIRMLPEDKVMLEVPPYDLSKRRIIYRQR